VSVTGGSGRRVNQETPPMRIYIIGNDGITLCREAPATVVSSFSSLSSVDCSETPPLAWTLTQRPVFRPGLPPWSREGERGGAAAARSATEGRMREVETGIASGKRFLLLSCWSSAIAI
jgi:hypothetical protein